MSKKHKKTFKILTSKKDPSECLASATNGVMPMPDFDPTGDQDYAKCVGEEKKIGW